MINRFLIAAPVAVALSVVFVGTAATPASAATIDCAVTSGNLRTAAATAEPGAARKALTYIRTGEALCADDARSEAAKKFAVAAKALGVDFAQVSGTATARRYDGCHPAPDANVIEAEYSGAPDRTSSLGAPPSSRNDSR